MVVELKVMRFGNFEITNARWRSGEDVIKLGEFCAPSGVTEDIAPDEIENRNEVNRGKFWDI